MYAQRSTYIDTMLRGACSEEQIYIAAQRSWLRGAYTRSVEHIYKHNAQRSMLSGAHMHIRSEERAQTTALRGAQVHKILQSMYKFSRWYTNKML